MSKQPEAPVGLSRHADQDLRRAWVAVGLLRVGFVLAMVVGEGLISVLGYQSGGEEPVPVGSGLVAGIPALVILVTPGMAAVSFGRRAAHGGRAAAMVPGRIGGVAAVAVVAQNLLTFLLGG